MFLNLLNVPKPYKLQNWKHGSSTDGSLMNLHHKIATSWSCDAPSLVDHQAASETTQAPASIRLRHRQLHIAQQKNLGWKAWKKIQKPNRTSRSSSMTYLDINWHIIWPRALRVAAQTYASNMLWMEKGTWKRCPGPSQRPQQTSLFINRHRCWFERNMWA